MTVMATGDGDDRRWERNMNEMEIKEIRTDLLSSNTQIEDWNNGGGYVLPS